MSKISSLGFVRLAGEFTSCTLIEMANNKLLYISVIFAIAGLAITGFISEVALTDSEHIQLALIASGYRFCAIFVMMIFVVSSVVREFNDKCLEMYLSMPISRNLYLTGKLFGFVVCGAVLAAVFSLALLIHASPERIAVWGVSLLMELCIVAVFALFAVLSFNQQITSSVFITFLFYLLCRSADTIKLIAESNIITGTLGNKLIELLLSLLYLVLPALSRFTSTEWLLYGGGIGELPWIAAQTAIYSLLIGSMCVFDLNRKNL